MSNSGDILAGLIALAGNDKKYAQKLAVIQDKIAEHDKIKAEAIAAKTAADVSIKTADQYNTEIKASFDKLNAQAAEVAAKKQELLAAKDDLENYRSLHKDNVDALDIQFASHKKNVSEFESSKRDFETYLKAKNQELAKREDAIKAAEDRAIQHEADASTAKIKLQSKLDAVLNAAKG